MIRPVLKKSNPTVGIVTPASAVEESLLHAALPAMERKGWHVRLGKNVYKRNRFCAGTDKERADDLHEFFKDENIDMIIAARGGYGTARLLPIIDFGLIAAHPKPFVGLSDTTAFQNALLKKCNIVTFSGFVPACDIRVIGQQLVAVVGHVGLRRGILVLIEMFVVINDEGHGQAVRHVPVHKVDPEFHEIAVFNAIAAEGRSVSLLFPRHRQRWVV